MNIRRLDASEKPPMNLLLLADPSKRQIEDYIKRGFTYVAELDLQMIGVYVLLPTRPKTVEIANVAIVEDKQDKGFGKRLIMDAIQESKNNGYQTIEVGTGNSSIAQLALYQKCGFRITGVDKNYFIRHYSDEIYENGIQCRDMIRMTLDL